MLRPAFLAFGLLLSSSTAFGQSAAADSQTLQALLEEVHQLRKDVQIAATSARRAQILIHRLYVQEAAVARAAQRLDETKAELEQLRNHRTYQLAQIKNYEDLRDRSADANQRTQLDASISYMKAEMESSVPMEQEIQTKETDLEGDFRTEQAKLDQIQSELDRLDRAVTSAALGRGSAQPSGATLQSISRRKLL